MEFSRFDCFVARLALIAVEHVPFLYSKKIPIDEHDYLVIDSALSKLQKERDGGKVDLNDAEMILVARSIECCILEESISMSESGESVGFCNYVNNEYGNVVERDFAATLNAIVINSNEFVRTAIFSHHSSP